MATEAFRRCLEEARASLGVLSRRRAIELGMSEAGIDRCIHRADLKVKHPGIYLVAGAPSSFEQGVKAATEWAGGGSAAGLRTAARLHELDGIRTQGIEIITPRRLRSDEVSTYRWTLDREDITRIGCIPITSIHRTLVDLGHVVDEETLEIAMYCALCRGSTSIQRLIKQVEWSGGAGRRGSAALRRLIAQAEGQPFLQSALEIKFERLARRSRLPVPIRQHPVSWERGTVYIDFYYPQGHLAIEAQSRKWHSRPSALESDCNKHNILVAAGFRVHYVTWQGVTRTPTRTVEEIRRLLAPPML